MTEWEAIQETVQQIAEAIAAVLKVEVEIADATLTRIAGTGRAQSGLLRTMAGEDYVYQSSLRTSQPFVIDHPGFHEICKPCRHFGHCPETGEICCPIQMDGQGIGVIGLLAFDLPQRQRLLADRENTMFFLKKIAEMIAAKFKEQALYVQRQVTFHQLTAVMDYVDQGVVLVNSAGEVIRLNVQAKEALAVTHVGEGLSSNPVTPVLIQQLFWQMPRDGIPQEVSLQVQNHLRKFLVSLRAVSPKEADLGFVMTIEDLERMVHIVSQIGKNSRDDPFNTIVGNTLAIQNVKQMARRVATSDSTILISGESGTGKELFARAIHLASRRSQGPLIAVNCASIPDNLLESELFGYEEGAFTGARKGGKIGKFEQADNGTLFLDEIGDMPLPLQVKILRTLQDQHVEPVGSSKGGKTVNVRVIAATHRNLEERISQGLFREDLFYRLNVIPLHIPPLRDRREDIIPIAEAHLEHYAMIMGKPLRGFTLDAHEMLTHYEWPGNVRELANAIEYAVNMAQGDRIKGVHLPDRIRRTLHAQMGDIPFLDLTSLEKAAISIALKKTQGYRGQKEQAAKLLGISRATLYRKMQEYGFTEDEPVSH
ncbi:transcriptional regulator [Alicyclobacillaceae bacterium I2511]|nr:transcriptional regulator [Alicyclobacillaceae bacterium I2511]